MFFIFFPCFLFSAPPFRFIYALVGLGACFQCLGQERATVLKEGRERVLGGELKKPNPAKILHKTMASFQSSPRQDTSLIIFFSGEEESAINFNC